MSYYKILSPAQRKSLRISTEEMSGALERLRRGSGYFANSTGNYPDYTEEDVFDAAMDTRMQKKREEEEWSALAIVGLTLLAVVFAGMCLLVML